MLWGYIHYWELWLVLMITANTTINYIRLRVERKKKQ